MQSSKMPVGVNKNKCATMYKVVEDKHECEHKHLRKGCIQWSKDPRGRLHKHVCNAIYIYIYYIYTAVNDVCGRERRKQSQRNRLHATQGDFPSRQNPRPENRCSYSWEQLLQTSQRAIGRLGTIGS